MTRLASLMAAFAAAAALACAQDEQQTPWRYRVELFGNGGAGGFYHGTSSWGRGTDYGFGIGVRPFSGALNGLGFEVQTARLTDNRNTASLDTRFIAANALYHFLGRSRIQPYLLGGYGLVRAKRDTTCTNCVFDVDPVTGALTPRYIEDHLKASKGGITFGTGLKIAVHRRVWIRSEFFFLNTTPGSGWNFARYRFHAGVGLHF